MKNVGRPAFILAMAGTALILAGLIVMPPYEFGMYLMYSGFLLAGIFWIWAMLDVVNAHDLKSFQKIFWLIVTISVPVMGGLMFYIMHQSRNKIVT